MIEIDGKSVANEIHQELKREIASFRGRKAGLAFILIGNDPASTAYVKMKVKGCQEVGIHSEVIKLPESISQNELIKQIEWLNENPEIDGILVQFPLPSHISTSSVVETIHPDKDVDGFHPLNMGKLMIGDEEALIACTPLGITTLLEKMDIDLSGKHVLIMGRSTIVGRPLSVLLSQKKPLLNATVTLAHSQTQNLASLSKTADVVIAAIGSPHFVGKEMIKEGAIVIDVGINRMPNKTLVGDVDFHTVKSHCSYITPVPGGVGPMTIAMLLSNTLKSYKKRCGSSYS